MQEADGLARVQKATQGARRVGDVETAITGVWLAGRFLLEGGRLEEAKAQLEAALDESRKFGLEPMARELEQMLSDLRARAPAPLGALDPGH